MRDFDKQFALRLLEMAESKLLTHRHLVSWADRQILASDGPPPGWICDLAITKYHPAIVEVLRALAYGEPFEAPRHTEAYSVACFFLRYSRREISWATFLRSCGEYTDRLNGEVECEYFYRRLNRYEESEYVERVEQEQVEEVRNRFEESIEAATKDYGFIVRSIVGPDG